MMETICEESFEHGAQSPQKVPSISQTCFGHDETPQSHRMPKKAVKRREPARLLNIDREGEHPQQQPQKTQVQAAQLEIVDRLGEGAFGEVLLVQDKHDPAILLAVKCINLNNITSKELLEGVRREVGL